MRPVRMALALSALILLAGCGGGGGGGGITIRSIDIQANDLVYDSVSKRLYASIPSAAGQGSGNSIAVINPVSAAIEKLVFVGSEPNRLAVSADGQFLYVALDGISAVRRVQVSTMTPDLQFPLEAGGAPQCTELAVLPGSPHTLVATLTRGMSDAWGMRVAMYDDGVQRSHTFDSPYSGFVWQSVACREDAAVVFVYRNDGSQIALYTAAVNADGLTRTATNTGLFSYWDGSLQVHTGRIYSYGGHVVDSSTINPIGAFSVINSIYAQPGYTVDEADHSARYFYGGGDSVAPTIQIDTFSTDTFVKTTTSTLKLPEFAPASSLYLSRPAQWSARAAAVPVSNVPYDLDPTKTHHKILLLSNLPE